MLESPNDQFLQRDLDLIADSDIPLSQLRNSTILVTGATGLIGSLLVRALACCNRKRQAGINIVALVRSPGKASAIYGPLLDRGDIELVVADIASEVVIEGAVDHIVHGASITASKQMVTQPIETIMTAVNGTNHLLALAKHKQVKSFVYVSSMEVYGVFDGIGGPVTEKDLGFLDLSKVRSNYPESKRLCENLCIAYLAESAVPVKIARLAQTFGAGVLPGESRVFAQFARCAMAGEDIVLHTHGRSEGNYCYTRDAVKALLTLMVRGENGQAYNVSNEATHTSIADMARMVASDIAGGKISVVFDIPQSNVFGYAADTRMLLDSSKLRALGWTPEVGLKEAYERLMGSLACAAS